MSDASGLSEGDDHLTCAPVPALTVLKTAEEANLTDVLVIGVERDGSMFYASSTSEKAKMLLWMELCRFYMMVPTAVTD
jgi:hypothetical protein